MSLFPTRALVDMPNWLGDFVHTLPFVQRLVHANRGGETTLLVPPAHVPLAALAGARPLMRPPGAGWRWGRSSLRGSFDLVVSARHATRAKAMLAASGAPLRAASEGRGARLLGLRTFHVDRTRHQRHDLDGALAAVGVAPVGEEDVRLAIPPGLVEEGRGWLAATLRDRPVLAVMPSSHARLAKRYPVAGFRAIAEELGTRGWATVVVVGPGEERLGAGVSPTYSAVCPTEWPLDRVAALLARCAAAVGNDSGLTHLASVVGSPTVALFGPTDPSRTAPVGGARILQPPADAPIAAIPPAEIVAAVLSFAQCQARHDA
jgi:ADP-heptose:LPS heptosyltransferase